MIFQLTYTFMVLRFFIFLILGCVLLPMQAQDDYVETVYLIRLDVSSEDEAKMCFTNRYDRERVKIEYAFEDTINYLADFIYEEDEMYGPDCFVPEIKLAFKYYTYVISLYCTKAVKYKNSAPYKASSTRMSNDIVFTQSVYDYLMALKNQHFGRGQTSLALLKKTVTDVPLDELDTSDLDDILLGEEEEEEALDPEDEALLKQDDGPAPKKRKIIPLEVEVDNGDG